MRCQKRSQIEYGVIGVVTGLLLCSANLDAESREWTNREGKTIIAELVAYDAIAGKLKLKLKSGREYDIAADTLGDDDQAYLDRLAEEKAKKRANAGKTIAMISKGDEMVPYHVYYPKSFDPDQAPPVAIMFDPGGNGMTMVNSMRDAVDKAGWIVIGCDRLKNGMEREESVPLEKGLLDDIRKRITFDPQRVYLGGLSGGSLRSFIISAELKEWGYDEDWNIAGILSFGGWLGGAEERQRDYQQKMAVALINGDDDEAANSHVPGDTAALKHRRCEVELFPFAGGHHMPKDPAVIHEAIAWLTKNH